MAMDTSPDRLNEEAAPLPPSPPIAPRTPTEALVGAVWCKLLELDAVSVTDNFFEIGGHSLAAAQVVHELAARTGIELELEMFFDLDTLADIAAEVDRRQADSLGRQSNLFEGEL
jgi:acyl carrier protein